MAEKKLDQKIDEEVIVYDLCDKEGKVLKKSKKEEILKNNILTVDDIKKLYQENIALKTTEDNIIKQKKEERLKNNILITNKVENSTQLKENALTAIVNKNGEDLDRNSEEKEYYIQLDKQLFAKVPSQDTSIYLDCMKNLLFKINVNVQNNLNNNHMYTLMIKNDNTFGFWPNDCNNRVLTFDAKKRMFHYYDNDMLYNHLEYKASMEDCLNNNGAIFHLYTSSYWKNLFCPDKEKYNTIQRAFGLADDGNNRCCIGCFSCSNVIAIANVGDNKYHTRHDEIWKDTQHDYEVQTSLNNMSSKISMKSAMTSEVPQLNNI